MRFGSVAGVLLLAACEPEVQLNVVVYDPCNQSTIAGADHVELVIARRDGAVVERATWSRADGRGEVDGIPTLTDAVVSIIGRDSDAAGKPADAVAAASAGYLDLTGAGDGFVQISLTLGNVGQFMRTTEAVGTVQCSSLAAERREHTATRLPDGRVLIAGGVRTNVDSTTYWESSEYYHPDSGSFSLGPNMSWTRRGHSATALPDGRVLIAGGLGLIDADGDSATTPVEQTLLVALLFDPEAESFGTPTPMNAQRAYHTATLLDDGTVLIAGGLFGTATASSTEVFDPTANSFRAGPTLLAARAHHAAVRIGKQTVALIGGRGDSAVLDDIEFVTTGPDQTIAGPVLSVARSHHAAAVVPGTEAILVVGGFDAAVTAPELGNGLLSVELVTLNTANLAASTTSLCDAALSVGRGALALATVTNGLLAVGGVDANTDVTATADLLTFANANSCAGLGVTATPNSLAVARGGAVVTELIGGDLLITGGFSTTDGQTVSAREGEIYTQYR